MCAQKNLNPYKPFSMHVLLDITWGIRHILLWHCGDSAENGIFLTDDSLQYFDLSHLSVISNGLSIKEETIENLLGVLPYHLELEFDCDGPENLLAGG